MSQPFRIGVMQLTMEPLEEILEHARAMDEGGFDTIWLAEAYPWWRKHSMEARSSTALSAGDRPRDGEARDRLGDHLAVHAAPDPDRDGGARDPGGRRRGALLSRARRTALPSQDARRATARTVQALITGIAMLQPEKARGRSMRSPSLSAAAIPCGPSG